MTAVHRKSNFIALSGIIFCTLLLTGCASSQAKLEAFQKSQGDKGFIYAQVNSVEPGINTKAACESNWGGEKLKLRRENICHRLDEINVIYVSHVKNLDILTSMEVLPSSVVVRPKSIIKLDLSKDAPFRFIEISAVEPTENCKWVGSKNDFTNDQLTKSIDVVSGFIAGVLIAPGVAYYLARPQGGVECNDWSFKTAYQDFLRKN